MSVIWPVFWIRGTTAVIRGEELQRWLRVSFCVPGADSPQFGIHGVGGIAGRHVTASVVGAG